MPHYLLKSTQLTVFPFEFKYANFWIRSICEPIKNHDLNGVVIRVSVQGVKSLGGHFACSCRGFKFYEVKKKFVIIFQKENGNTFTLLIIFIVKSIQKEKIAKITQYDP